MLLDGCIFAVLAGVYSIPIVDEIALLGFRGPPFFLFSETFSPVS